MRLNGFACVSWLTATPSMPQSSENNLLRFGCPACGIRLVVDQSIANTEGPCPSCGARIIAPPLDVSRSLSERQASPVAIKPRGVSTGPLPPSISNPVSQPDGGVVLSSDPEPIKKPQRRARAVDPTMVLSVKHLEKKKLKVFFKIMIALAVVVGIALAVFYFLKQAG